MSGGVNDRQVKTLTRANERHAVQVEVEDAGDTEAQVIPRGFVVTRPVAGMCAETGEGGAGEDERALVGHAFKRLAGGDGFGEAVEVVDVKLAVAVAMENPNVDGLCAERVMIVVVVDVIVRVTPRPALEVGHFIHVDPKAINRNPLEEAINLLPPVVPPHLRQEVRENSVPGPYVADVIAALRVLHERVHLHALVERDIPRRVLDARVNDDDVLLTLRMKRVDEVAHARLREVVRVPCPILVVVHVVNIRPHCVKWNPVRPVLGDNVF